MRRMTPRAITKTKGTNRIKGTRVALMESATWTTMDKRSNSPLKMEPRVNPPALWEAGTTKMTGDRIALRGLCSHLPAR
jgi:hypothetical protein